MSCPSVYYNSPHGRFLTRETGMKYLIRSIPYTDVSPRKTTFTEETSKEVEQKQIVKDEDPCYEDSEKLHLKRQRNKEAAVRCRQKRKDRVRKLLQEIEKLEDDNQHVHRQIRNLELQKLSLQKIIREHDTNCGVICYPLSNTRTGYL